MAGSTGRSLMESRYCEIQSITSWPWRRKSAGGMSPGILLPHLNRTGGADAFGGFGGQLPVVAEAALADDILQTATKQNEIAEALQCAIHGSDKRHARPKRLVRPCPP